MPGQNQQESKSFFEQMKDATNIAYGASKVMSMCFIPFLRVGMGTHAMTWLGPLALALMFVWGSMTEQPALFAYMAAWLVAVVVQRLCRDRSQCSTYHGRPAARPGRGCSRSIVRTRAAAEIPLLMFTGLLVYGAESEPFGVFLLCGAFALGLKEYVDREYDEAMVRQMRDAAISQRNLAERVRHEDWF